MASSLMCVAFTLSLCFVPVYSASDQCVPLKDGPFEDCRISGYNHTFPIPFELSTRTKQRLKSSVQYLHSIVSNCSVASIAETMSCSFLSPYCRNGNAVLPCRRVCSEFLKRCYKVIPTFFVDLMVATCTILPNSTASEGKCYEPPNFIKHYNPSSKGPLERKCGEIIFPFCKDIGYPLTLITVERQKYLYEMFYGKNYTNKADKDLDKPFPESLIQELMYTMGNHSSCGLNIQKLFCSDLISPCFKNEGLAYYTVCKNVCLSIGAQCPKFLSSDSAYFFYCERMAAGNATLQGGFCKHTSWPPPMKWLDVYRDRPTRSTKVKGGIGGAVIAVIVVLSVIIVGVTIGLVYYFKRRKLTSKGYSRQEDDKADLVT